MNLLIRLVLSILAIGLVLACGCHSRRSDGDQSGDAVPAEGYWCETSARIINIVMFPGGKYGYTLEYTPTESTAVRADGTPLNDTIQHHYFAKDERPLEGQRVRVRYMRTEPAVYERLDPIDYAETESRAP